MHRTTRICICSNSGTSTHLDGSSIIERLSSFRGKHLLPLHTCTCTCRLIGALECLDKTLSVEPLKEFYKSHRCAPSRRGRD